MVLLVNPHRHCQQHNLAECHASVMFTSFLPVTPTSPSSPESHAAFKRERSAYQRLQGVYHTIKINDMGQLAISCQVNIHLPLNPEVILLDLYPREPKLLFRQRPVREL